MNKQITGIVASIAVTGWVLTAAGEQGTTLTGDQATAGGLLATGKLVDADQIQYPRITAQPTDQDVPLGSNAVLTVECINADSFQWLRNGVVIPDQTNSSLTLSGVSVKDVGYYTCCAVKGYEVVPTRTASMTAFSSTGGGMITVFGLPVVSGGGTPGNCPGPYAGYINFIKTASDGWGWAPTAGTTLHTVTDTNRTDTKVVYVGKMGDGGCGPTTVAVPDPTVSTKYRFTIYFPNNVPTNSYAITLSGFDP